MSFDIRPLLTVDYWLTLQPPTGLMDGIGRFVFAGFVIIFGLGIVARLVNARRSDDKYVSEAIRRIANLLIVMGLLGAMLFFLSFQQIPFFGAPFWYLIWLLGFFMWLAWIVRYMKVIVPAEKMSSKERETHDKYLPNTKRKH